MEHLQIQFDSMGVYDNTYVGILQTAYASGLKEFPMPCVFTNCHNCLCAVGGTINTDVHKYAESACKNPEAFLYRLMKRDPPVYA